MFSTYEEVESAVCDYITSVASNFVLYIHGHPRICDIVEHGDCACALDFQKLLAPYPEWELADLYFKTRPFSHRDMTEFKGRQPYQRGLCTLTVQKAASNQVRPVYLSVAVDEFYDGPLPVGENPENVFKALKKRLLRTKVPGRFFWEGSEEPVKRYRWTQGAKALLAQGAELFDMKVRVLADGP